MGVLPRPPLGPSCSGRRASFAHTCAKSRSSGPGEAGLEAELTLTSSSSSSSRRRRRATRPSRRRNNSLTPCHPAPSPLAASSRSSSSTRSTRTSSKPAPPTTLPSRVSKRSVSCPPPFLCENESLVPLADPPPPFAPSLPPSAARHRRQGVPGPGRRLARGARGGQAGAADLEQFRAA